MFSKFLKGCWLALLLSVVSLSVKAEDSQAFNPYQYGMYTQHFPAVCGEYAFVENLLEQKGFVPSQASIGRVGANPQGDPVFLIMLYRNNDQLLMTMETPQQQEKCIMFLTFNTIVIPKEE
tara:strand:+ start:125 stop:487 length:363 start_codon:yes stop_codon:yes gene_type:complete